jgi:hypothetical protein
MSAKDFVLRYHMLQARNTANQVFTVACRTYLINVESDSLTKKKQEIGRVRSASKQIDPGAFNRASIGKATPWDLEHVLNCALQSGTVPAKTDAELQTWVDANLGVDCTGFASAYFVDQNYMDIDNIPNNSCFEFLRIAQQVNGGVKAKFIWEFDDVLRDDVILWMNDAGLETQKPGHIAIVYDKKHDRLLCGESNGAVENGRATGPKLTERMWGKKTQGKVGGSLDIGPGVIIVRPFQTPAASAYRTEQIEAQRNQGGRYTVVE